MRSELLKRNKKKRNGGTLRFPFTRTYQYLKRVLGSLIRVRSVNMTLLACGLEK